MANLTDQKILAAHTAKIYLDGTEVGYLQNVQVNIGTGLVPAFCIGSVEDQEHQQTHYTVNGSFARYYVRDTLIEDSKLGARTAASMIRTGTFDIDILDDVTGQVVISLEKCTLGSKGMGIQPGALISHQFSFSALRTR
ncbi:MAG TPA: hypothetical protein VN436_12825 [Holophaga sp.]|nr:hypothetical protein [Holophaga sp.]